VVAVLTSAAAHHQVVFVGPTAFSAPPAKAVQ